jgi:hypothetical protein
VNGIPAEWRAARTRYLAAQAAVADYVAPEPFDPAVLVPEWSAQWLASYRDALRARNEAKAAFDALGGYFPG